MPGEEPPRPGPAGALPPDLGTLADEFHVSTRSPRHAQGSFKAHEYSHTPEILELAAEAPLRLDGRRVFLPPPDPSSAAMSLGEAVQRRRSGRTFGAAPLSAAFLATLLYLGNGVRQAQRTPSGMPVYSRNVANSGNLGSVEVFPVVLDVAGVQPGIYHFDSTDGQLVGVRSGHFGTWLSARVLFQLDFEGASAVLVLACAMGRLQKKYGQRGYRLGLMDVGHVSENLYLAGAALGLEVCATAGFVDEELDAALGLDGLDTASMLVVAVGVSDGPPPAL